MKIRSFGPDIGDFAVTAEVTEDGVIWAAPRNRYEISRWDTAGSALSTIHREAEWFEPWSEWVYPDMGRPPPRIRGLWLDREGRLWTLSLVSDEDFTPAEELSPYETYDWEHPQYDTILEVIDVDRGVLLAARRFPGLLAGPRGGVVASYETDRTGNQMIHLQRLEFHGEGETPHH